MLNRVKHLYESCAEMTKRCFAALNMTMLFMNIHVMLNEVKHLDDPH